MSLTYNGVAAKQRLREEIDLDALGQVTLTTSLSIATATHGGKHLIYAGSGALTITLSDIDDGTYFWLSNKGSGTITLSGAATLKGYSTITQDEHVFIQHVDTNIWEVSNAARLKAKADANETEIDTLNATINIPINTHSPTAAGSGYPIGFSTMQVSSGGSWAIDAVIYTKVNPAQTVAWQTKHELVSRNVYTREYSSSTWTSWKRLANEDDIGNLAGNAVGANDAITSYPDGLLSSMKVTAAGNWAVDAIILTRRSGSEGTQLRHKYSGELEYRQYSSSAWTPWYRFATENDIGNLAANSVSATAAITAFPDGLLSSMKVTAASDWAVDATILTRRAGSEGTQIRHKFDNTLDIRAYTSEAWSSWASISGGGGGGATVGAEETDTVGLGFATYDPDTATLAYVGHTSASERPVLDRLFVGSKWVYRDARIHADVRGLTNIAGISVTGDTDTTAPLIDTHIHGNKDLLYVSVSTDNALGGSLFKLSHAVELNYQGTGFNIGRWEFMGSNGGTFQNKLRLFGGNFATGLGTGVPDVETEGYFRVKGASTQVNPLMRAQNSANARCLIVYPDQSVVLGAVAASDANMSNNTLSIHESGGDIIVKHKNGSGTVTSLNLGALA